jgi:hypothetical protein
MLAIPLKNTASFDVVQPMSKYLEDKYGKVRIVAQKRFSVYMRTAPAWQAYSSSTFDCRQKQHVTQMR